MARVIESEGGMAGLNLQTSPIIAFKLVSASVTVGTDPTDTGDAEHMAEPTPPRTLRKRPSDAVDMTDPALRQRFREVMNGFKKGSYDCASYPTFPGLVQEMFRNVEGGSGSSALSALSQAVRITFRISLLLYDVIDVYRF